MKNSGKVLVLGDIVTLGVVTFIGFATHGEMGILSFPRMLTTYVPLITGWFLLSPWFGLFSSNVISDPKQLWRPALAMFLAAPIAGVLRAILLSSALIPVFIFVLGLTSAFGVEIWRGFYFLIHRKDD